MDKNRNKFLTYDEQIKKLKSKKLKIEDETYAINCLKKYSYYSLISGYKDIFKIEKNGNYKNTADFNKIVYLYEFDNELRNIFFQKFIQVEKYIKSLYSYYFCDIYGDKQKDYLNKRNYNYLEKYKDVEKNIYVEKYKEDIDHFVDEILKNILEKPKYPYVKYKLDKYKSVPLWVIMQVLTFGNIAKVYMFSHQQLQSKIAIEFNNIYGNQLSSILTTFTKFRNVCAHGERLYNYKARTSIVKLQIHKSGIYNSLSRNDLFNVVLCFGYILERKEFNDFILSLKNQIKILNTKIGDNYLNLILDEMGFPKNWEKIIASI